MPNRGNHHLFDISHPELDIAIFGINLFNEVNFLTFTGEHSVNGVIISKLKVSHGLEDFSKMRSYISDFLCLRQDFEKLIVREEIETSEI
jgi:hypothetical protein